ncbi:MAG: GNAT family N-acetyltransferase [Candidatus Sericytochromatia bacterium]|nr:GNAT family N-acetyltransferase [Candidatus Sericytochromatia bacterium]
MAAAVRIRRYQPADFESIAQLAVDASAQPETACGQPDVASVAEFQTDYGHRALESEAWVGESADGQVVAFAAGTTRRGVVLIDGPIVASGWRGQGLGRSLFERISDEAAEQGVEWLEVGVRSTNQRGDDFLETLGCETCREVFVYESHQPARGEFLVPEGYSLADLKPRSLLPFLMVMHECFPGYRLPSTPQRLFEPDRMKIMLVLDPADQVAGAVTAFFYPEDGHGYLYHLGISEPHRGKGLARALLAHASNWLWEAHQPHLIGLSTSDDLTLRQKLFHPLGFALQYSLRYRRRRTRQPAPQGE